MDQTPLDYIYSSASNCIENTGLIKVTLADNPVINSLNLSNIHKMNSYDWTVRSYKLRTAGIFFVDL